MKFISYVHSGFEDSAIFEIKLLINPLNIEKNESLISFELNDNDKKLIDKIAKLVLYSKTSRRIYVLFDKFEFIDFDDLSDKYKAYFQKNIYELKLNEFINLLNIKNIDTKEISFCSRTIKDLKDSDFKSNDLDMFIGDVIITRNQDDLSKRKTNLKVRLEAPDFILGNLIIQNVSYFGLDLCNADLGKRDYKIFGLPTSIKPSVIASIIYKIIDEKFLKNILKKNIVNYNINDGCFLIELAQIISNTSALKQKYKELMLNKYVDLNKFFDFDENCQNINFELNGMDSGFNTLSTVKKNLALSNVKKYIKLSKLDITWLDTKFDKKSIDLFFSFYLPTYVFKDNDLKKYCDDLLYQLDYVLKDKAVILTTKPELFYSVLDKKKYSLVLSEEFNFSVGSNFYNILILKKETNLKNK